MVFILTGCTDAYDWFSESGEQPVEATSPMNLNVPPPVVHDWEAIQARDTLVVLTTTNSTSFFIYRGERMGYEYDLLRNFAHQHDLQLRLKRVKSRDSLYIYLNQGLGDLIADRMVPLATDTSYVAFTTPLYRTQPVLVQQRIAPDALDTTDAVDTLLSEHAPLADEEAIEALEEDPTLRIRQPAQLVGEIVTLSAQSPYEYTLQQLNDTLTGTIAIEELDDSISDEAVIRMVARGEVEFTAAPQNLAELKQAYFTNLRSRPVLAKPHDVAWVVRRNAPALQAALNTWIDDHRQGNLFEEVYATYFVDRKGYKERVDSEYLTSETGKLSAYDDLIQKYAADIAWDWRLLAAQMYQESRFKPRARSWAGAAGLLQLMPATAREVGVKNPYDPEQNIAGAVRYIEWLERYWSRYIPEEDELLKFVLASYNVGLGHLQDARRLTTKHGGDATQWDEVSYWLLQKSKRKYYTDPVVRYGFARGLEPVTYVSRILDRFEHYLEFVG